MRNSACLVWSVLVIMSPSAAAAQSVSNKLAYLASPTPGVSYCMVYDLETKSQTTLSTHPLQTTDIRSLIPSYAHDGSLYAYQRFANTSAIWRISPGQQPTVATLSGLVVGHFMSRGMLCFDQNGSSCVRADGWLHRFDWNKPSNTKSLFNFLHTGIFLHAATMDPRSGGWLVLFNSSHLGRITRSGKLTTLATVSLPMHGGHLIRHPETNDVYISGGTGILKYSTRTGTLQTIITGGTLVQTDVVPIHCGFVTGAKVNGKGVLAVYYLDGSFRKATTIAIPMQYSSYLAPRAWGEGNARPGATYRIRLHYPEFASKYYGLAASLDYPERGIPMIGRSIRLSMDPLFWFSLLPQPVFTQFAGVIAANGGAVGNFNIPNKIELVGIMVYVGGILYENARIREIIPTVPIAISFV